MESGRFYPDSGAGRWWTGLRQVAPLIALLAGCAGAPETREAGPVNLSGFSPSFKEGYADGCESAGTRSQRRNKNRYQTEADYMRGWNDGFSVCQRRR